MTEKERQSAIEILQSGGHLVCAGLIEKFVWANMTKPRFPFGSPVQFVTGLELERINGDNRETANAETVTGSVIRIERRLGDRTFLYHVAFQVDMGNGQIKEYRECLGERELRPAEANKVNLFDDFNFSNSLTY